MVRAMSLEDIAADNVGQMRLERALSSMYHEQGSEEIIRQWYTKQKDFWGGVQAVKKLLWPYAAAMGPLEGLFRTRDLRLVCKQSMGTNASLSRPQLAVALSEMGFVVLFHETEKFNTNFPCKRVVAAIKESQA